ncbi:unnamed protein product, partial [Mesorhabditis belari]|uniref:Uncharacterized protein n=1 Tax=Mesorhabditis belari TaxID=2138241 RepID=A0AAF3FKW2_9BILA
MKSLLSGYYNHGMLKIAIYIQSIFQNAIFEKSLKLNAEARGKYDVGYLVNLMAVDVERICSFIPFATELVTIPVQLLFSMMFLTWSLGISALGGLFVIISVIIFNILSSRLIKRFQAKQMQLKDERTKMCNEVLNGVKLIKLYAWEEAFERKIHELRTKEVKMIKKINLIGRSVDVINEASAFLVAFVVFGLVVLNTNGGNLTPEICLLIIDKKKQFNLFNSFSVVFVALAVFAQLRRPMRVLAQTLLHLVQAKVSQARVESFLMENEILIKKGEEIWTKNEAIKIEKGSFKWSELNGKICLSELNFVVKRGELVGIVGEVGAGKSSLLAAILDEMIQKTGKVTKSGSLSYSPQQPWIINTTIRENILLGKPFNPDLFKRIIQATELQEDLSRFEHGELTELGENGVTLSGGQKARLGLARALYQDCEIVLLDDILSAVDVHNETQNNEMMQKENLETGRVKNSIYLAYLRTLSLSLSILTISSQILGIGMGIWKSLWLAKWTSETTSDQTISRKEIVQRFIGFTGIGLAESLFLLISTLALMIGCERASLRLHSPLLHSILRAPMEFFDTTPIGRILNRLSRDLEVIDSQLPRTLSDLSANFSQLLLSITMMCIAIPEFLIIVIPFLIINYLILRYYISAARQLKRLEGINRSPILAKFRETIQGAASIRAYKMIDREVYAFFHRIDELARCRFLSYTSNRWLGLRLELLCNITVLVVSIFGLIMSKFDAISPSMLGLCISYALNISEVLYFGVRMVSELETQTISVERIEEYSRLPSEKSWRLSTKPPSNWPSKGQITWTDYSLRYRKELPLIIKQITAKTSENEKVAIVGRTGSGKSSLAIGLYRLIESTSGSLTIDGVDISQIGLHDLRENLTIIPQESVLFSGSIRFNLDPFFTHDDDRLWHVLEECQLKTFFANTQEKLDFQIFEGGLNISMGQRQLICLGRALLRKSKILVLDEATASCDPHTDAIVQSIIRRNFKNSTILAIAHRLNTIADYDRIMVLAKGEIVEFDSPQVLLSNKNSHYSQLLRRINRKLKV